MGNKTLTSEEIISRSIDEDIKRDARQEAMTVKLVILGLDDAGKSTFVKQLRIIQNDQFTADEIIMYKQVLRQLCLSGMQQVLKKSLDWDCFIPAAQKDQLDRVLKATELSPEIGGTITLFMTSSILEPIWARSSEIKFCGGVNGVKYYLQNAERFAATDFIPNNTDILLARLISSGITEYELDFSSTHFTFVDVAGQLGRKEKWLSCFDSVTAVIFFSAMDDYDVLDEQEQVSRMDISIQLFSSMSSYPCFRSKSFILFLNKSDLFFKKIQEVPLESVFPDFKKGNSKDMLYADACSDYIKDKFVNSFKGSRVYPFLMCAIDTNLVQRLFSAVRDTIITEALTCAGL